MPLPIPISWTSVDQVAVVVRDLDAAMAGYLAQGVGPWNVYTYGPHRMPQMAFRGEEHGYVMKLALAYIGPTMWELIESVEGPNVYEEHLAAHGEGLHHIGYSVPDIEVEIARMAEQGFALLQSGHGFGLDGDGAYAYFDTEASLGCIIEAVQFPREMPPPERVVG